MRNRKARKSKQVHNRSLGNSMAYTCRDLAIAKSTILRTSRGILHWVKTLSSEKRIMLLEFPSQQGRKDIALQ